MRNSLSTCPNLNLEQSMDIPCLIKKQRKIPVVERAPMKNGHWMSIYSNIE